MKKIGFIDLFIDEWHSNNYPAWIATSGRRNDFEVAMAWEEHPKEERRDLQKWCKDMNVRPGKSIEEIVEECDCFCVLAPSNPEAHERLAELPLASGKPTYIDKPFAQDRPAAERLFARADKYRTPLMSSSALRFSDGLAEYRAKKVRPEFVLTTGGGTNFPEYAIHQVEMIVSTMGPDVKKVCVHGTSGQLSAVLFYGDGRIANISYSPKFQFSFRSLSGAENFAISSCSHHFENLLEEMLEFFATGVSSVPREETLAVASIRRALTDGLEKPGTILPVS